MTAIDLLLKAVLLYGLNQFLLSNDEVSTGSFIITSQTSYYPVAWSGYQSNPNPIPRDPCKAMVGAAFGVDDNEKL